METCDVSAGEVHASPPIEAIVAVVSAVFPTRHIAAVERLADGLCNESLKVSFDADEAVVLRVYARDPTICRREVELLWCLRNKVPVPEVLEVFPDGLGQVGPCLLTRFVEGISFRQLRAMREVGAIAEAAGSIGETLAAIGRHCGPEPAASDPESTVGDRDAIPAVIERCLASTILRSRLDERTRDGVRRAVESRANELAGLLEDRTLVHGDFNNRNVIVRVGSPGTELEFAL